MGKPSSSDNEETERKAGYGCELAPKIPEGKLKIKYFAFWWVSSWGKYPSQPILKLFEGFVSIKIDYICIFLYCIYFRDRFARSHKEILDPGEAHWLWSLRRRVPGLSRGHIQQGQG